MKQCQKCGLKYDALDRCPICGCPDYDLLPEGNVPPPVPPEAPAYPQEPAFPQPQEPAQPWAETPTQPAAAPLVPVTGTQKTKKSAPVRLIAVLAVLLVAAAVILTVVFFPKKTGAALPLMKLLQMEDGVTYTGYDVTGDGKADEIRAVYRTYAQTGNTGEAVIYVNGKEVQTFSSGTSAKAILLAPDKSNVFLAVKYAFKGGSDAEFIYKYSNGAFSACGEESVIRLSQGDIKEVGPGCFTAEMRTGQYEQWLIARDEPLVFEAVYDLVGSTATCRSDTVPAGGNYVFTANKSFTASSSPAGNDAAGCSVSQGDTVQVTRCCIGGADPCFEIVCNGVAGWVSRALSGDYADPLLRQE